MESVVLKAIIERYGGLVALYEYMRDDEDTVLVNLSSDIDGQFSEDEILAMIEATL